MCCLFAAVSLFISRLALALLVTLACNVAFAVNTAMMLHLGYMQL